MGKTKIMKYTKIKKVKTKQANIGIYQLNFKELALLQYR